MIASSAFPGLSWQEIEALPQPLRWTVQRTIFHLLDEPVPTLADPFPRDDPLPGAYDCWHGKSPRTAALQTAGARRLQGS